MANFGEQPTSPNRKRLNENEDNAENIKAQLSSAVAVEDYTKVAELGGEMKASQKQREEFKNKDKEEAYAENIKRQLTEAVAVGDAEKIMELGEQMKNNKSPENKDNKVEKTVSPEQLQANLEMLAANAAKLDQIPEKVLQSKEGQEETQSFMGKITGKFAGFRQGVADKLAKLDSWKGREILAYSLIGVSTAAVVGPVMLQLARSKWPEVGAALDSAPDAIQQFIHMDLWAKVAETFGQGSDLVNGSIWRNGGIEVSNLLADISSGKESIASLDFNQAGALRESLGFADFTTLTSLKDPSVYARALAGGDVARALGNMPLVGMAGAGMFGVMSKIGALANQYKTKTETVA